jgi:hypothetical protein
LDETYRYKIFNKGNFVETSKVEDGVMCFNLTLRLTVPDQHPAAHAPLISKGIQMNTLRKQILIGLTVLGMGTATLAAHADEGGWGHGGGDQHGRQHGGQMMGERMAHFRAHLHDKLKLSAAQEPAWNAYVAATTPPKPAAGAHQGMDGKGQHPDFATMSAPQKLQMFDDMAKKRLAMQESHLAALKTFYATLTPEQQKTFDHAIAMGMHRRHHHHHHWRHEDHEGYHHGWN